MLMIVIIAAHDGFWQPLPHENCLANDVFWSAQDIGCQQRRLITFAGDDPQSASRQSKNRVSVGSHRSMIEDMFSDIPADLAVRERLLAMCNDRHSVSRAARIALASAHPAV